MFLTGKGHTRVRSVSPFTCANPSSAMMPSTLLSNRAQALISLPDLFPTSVTLRMIEGARLFRIVFSGTCSAPSVSSKGKPLTAPLAVTLPTDSASEEEPKNLH